MSELILPREWCTSGTKTDPGAAGAATGFVAGNPAAAAHFNFLLNQTSIAAREVFRRANYPRYVFTTDDVSGYVGAMSTNIGPNKPVMVANVNTSGTLQFWGDRRATQGVLASINVSARAVAKNNVGRLVVVGSGGNHNCFSTNHGVSWTAGGALGGVGLEVLWNQTYSRFQACYVANMAYSTDATSWTSVAVAGAAASGMARLSDGRTFILTGGVPPVVQVSNNGGTSWASTGGTLSYAADLQNKGCIAGRGDSLIYHAALHTDGSIRVASSADGVVWAQSAQLTVSGLTLTNATFEDLRLVQCPDTGLLALTCLTNFGTVLFASADQGNTWSDPWQLSNTVAARGVDVASGRIVVQGSDGVVFISDGIV